MTTLVALLALLRTFGVEGTMHAEISPYFALLDTRQFSASVNIVCHFLFVRQKP